MHKIYQTTLSNPLTFEGVGLHSGTKSIVKVNPGIEDSGIIFKRVDLSENNLIEANYKNVTSAKLCTTLENKHGVKVSTVEHLLAALYIAEIDNAVIEIDNKEVPIMDGSAKIFLDKLSTIKTKTLTKKRKYIKILDKVELKEEHKKISIEPNNTFEVDFELNYKNQIIGNQKSTINFQKDNTNVVSESRTFCLYEDIEKIKQAGLAKGGSLQNAIVVDNDRVINEGGLRNKNEFVNHKILDLAGDFLLSGFRILGKVKCHQGGHEFTNKFLRKLLSSNTCYKYELSEDFKISQELNISKPLKLAASA
jgi:UDP-3-O-[3-hydroxymyristoyl] N-acetylglucosamine deacetylase